MKSSYIISKKVMARILSNYGGRRKYRLEEAYTQKQADIVFVEKKDKNKWLTIRREDKETLAVSLTDGTGRIVRWDFYTNSGEPVREEDV